MKQGQIRVTLVESGEEDLLTFEMKEGDEDDYLVNLSDANNSQTQLKRVFSRLLTLLVDGDIELVLEVDEHFSRALQKEVSEEYIAELNKELIEIRQKIEEEMIPPSVTDTDDEAGEDELDDEDEDISIEQPTSNSW